MYYTIKNRCYPIMEDAAAYCAYNQGSLNPWIRLTWTLIDVKRLAALVFILCKFAEFLIQLADACLACYLER